MSNYDIEEESKSKYQSQTDGERRYSQNSEQIAALVVRISS